MGTVRKFFVASSAFALSCALLVGAGTLTSSPAGATTFHRASNPVERLGGHRVVGFDAAVTAIDARGFRARVGDRAKFVAVRAFTSFRLGQHKAGFSDLEVGDGVHVLGVKFPRLIDAIFVRIREFRSTEFGGTVTSLGSGYFTVLRDGQSVTVNVSSQTVYRERGVPNAGFADVAVGDAVRLFVRKTATAGTVDAETVTIEPFRSVELVGYVASVNASGFAMLRDHQSFIVDVSNQTSFHEPGNPNATFSDVVVGQHVGVFGSATAIAGTVDATRVDIGSFPLANFSGRVASTGAASFVVQHGAATITVEVAGQTTYREKGVSNATFADVRVGDVVHVFATKSITPGTVDALHVVIGLFPYVERNGSVIAIAPSSFTVLAGRQMYTIDVDSQTVFNELEMSGVTFSDLADGDVVNVLGARTSTAGTVTALEVFIQPFRPVVLEGTVTAISTGNFALLVRHQNFTIDVSDQTTYVDSGVTDASFANLANGQLVRVFATKTATAGTVDGVGIVILSR